MGRHRRRGRRGIPPAALTALVAVGVLGGIAGASTISSQTTAHTGGKRAVTAGSQRAAASVAPSSSAPSPSAAPQSSAASSAQPSPSASSSQSSAQPSSDQASPSASASTAGLGSTAVVAANDESNRVGALFSGSVGPGNHLCSASVIHSSTQNLILTAAHCLAGTDGVTFVPGYRDGSTPFGTWQAVKIYTTDGWKQNSDPDEDFAIVELAPLNGHRIEEVVGGNPLGTDASFTAQVRLYGYPGNTEDPILCTNTTTQSDTYQRRVDCPSFPAGTSGGPFIDTSDNKVIGVIGGYQQGGDTDDTSYSSYFDHTVAGLYQQAVSGSS